MTQGRADQDSAPRGPWTVLSLIRWSADWLEGKGVAAAQARLDVEHLLAQALETTRLQLYLQFERPLTPDELGVFKPLLLRRGGREPLQYILGRAAFRNLDLRVDSRVLIPRPETEELVEAVLEWARGTVGADRRPLRATDGGYREEDRVLTALDVGTGSGCIALALAQEGPFRKVVATDASPDALDLARQNAEETGLDERVELRHGSLFRAVEGERFDVVASNPPYVADAEAAELQPEVREHEPAAALFAGGSGRDVLEPLVTGAPEHLVEGGLLAVEVGLGQAPGVADAIRATGAFAEPTIRRDLARRPRMVLARRLANGPSRRDEETGTIPTNER